MIVELYKRIYINGIETDYLIRPDGEVYSINKNKFLKKMISNSGYHYVNLYVNKKLYHCLIHRLVAFSFCKNTKPDIYTIVNHIDGDKTNNVYDNLEWCDCKYNNNYRYILGYQNARGEDNPTNKYGTHQIISICELLMQGYPCGYIANVLKVPPSLVISISIRKTWTHISNSYIFIESKFRFRSMEDYTDLMVVYELLKQDSSLTISDITKIINKSYEYTRSKIRTVKSQMKLN